MDNEDLDTELDRELEKLRRRQKLAKRNSESEEVGPKRKGRLSPYDKNARKYDWKAELEEEDEDGNNRDDSDD